jgi:hypothetical protein
MPVKQAVAAFFRCSPVQPHAVEQLSRGCNPLSDKDCAYQSLQGIKNGAQCAPDGRMKTKKQPRAPFLLISELKET